MDRTLLLVDDEPNIVSALTRLFRRDQYRILSANSGKDALALLGDNPVGVILSDQRMPVMTGTEFLTHAKEIQPESVRIVLSGYTELESVTDAINRGSVFRFLTKPWDDELLRTQVRDAFTHYELKQRNLHLTEELREKNEALERAAQLLQSALTTTMGELDFGLSALKLTQQVLHQAPIALICYSMDGMITIANRRASALFPGISIGQTLDSVLPAELCTVALTELANGVYTTTAGERFRYQTNLLHPEFRQAESAPLGMILTLIRSDD